MSQLQKALIVSFLDTINTCLCIVSHLPNDLRIAFPSSIVQNVKVYSLLTRSLISETYFTKLWRHEICFTLEQFSIRHIISTNTMRGRSQNIESTAETSDGINQSACFQRLIECPTDLLNRLTAKAVGKLVTAHTSVNTRPLVQRYVLYKYTEIDQTRAEETDCGRSICFSSGFCSHRRETSARTRGPRYIHTCTLTLSYAATRALEKVYHHLSIQ